MNRTRETTLVTGGAGFIGSELTAQLAAAGRRVVVLDNLSVGRRENLDGLPADRVRLVVGDIRDREVLASLLPEISIVFHLACVNLRHALVAPRDAHDVNATATLDLLIAAREAGVSRFVHVSSSEVYGSACAETMSEDHPTRPTTAYGASKLAGEAYARAFCETYAFPVVVVRPFNSFGPRSHHEGTSGEVIPRFLVRALAGQPLTIFGDGGQTRDFTFVDDTARGILMAGSTDTAIGRTINIGSGREVSVQALADAVRSVAGRPDVTVTHLEPRPGDIGRQRADIGLAQRLLGFEARVSFHDGLQRLRDWILQGAL
jgi:UDP-glucose 4-epimerase